MLVRVLHDVSLPPGRNVARGTVCEMEDCHAATFLAMDPPRVEDLTPPPKTKPAPKKKRRARKPRK